MAKVKIPIGLLGLTFYPVSASGYAAGIEMGSSVKAYLSVETNDLTIYGDDTLELDQSVFKRGTLTTETWFDDLELETKILGGKYEAITNGTDKEAKDHIDDVVPDGAVSFIRKLLKREAEGDEKTIVYRAVFLPKATASKSAQKEEADTKGDSLDPKTHPVDFTIAANSSGFWRYRADFDTEEKAMAYIAAKASAT